jgi:hypothetical protein
VKTTTTTKSIADGATLPVGVQCRAAGTRD